MFLEWSAVADDLILVATDTRTWVHRPCLCPGTDPFCEPMTGRGSTRTTFRLLDGAVGLLQRAALKRPPAPPLTAERYVERLVAHYYTTHWSAWQLRRAATRFLEGNRPELARVAQSLARYEESHDLLAVRDLEALGYPSEYASRAPMSSQTGALLHFALRSLAGPHPVTIFGYGFALLRSARAVTAGYLREVQAVLPPGVNATRCIRAHSALAESTEHLDRLVETVAALPAEDRVRVVRAAYETAQLIFTIDEAPRPRAPRETPGSSRQRISLRHHVEEVDDPEEAALVANR